jgi:ABC-2 type transport system permease protein
VVTAVRNLAGHRGLLRLLVERDLTVRYKRSLLGVWWTLLNPMLTMGVMWVVFSQLFHLQGGQVPYLVYLFSGLVVFTFFQQVVTAVGASLTASSGLLSKVHVPAEVFSVAAALAVSVNFCISAAVLLVIEVIAGPPPLHLSLLLAPFSVVCLLAFATGLGLVLATLAVRFYDALDLSAVLITLTGYLTPTFYPESIVPARFLPLLHANPLYSHLRVFRAVFFGQEFPPAWTIAVTAGSAVVMLLIGAAVFSRSWRSIAVML